MYDTVCVLVSMAGKSRSLRSPVWDYFEIFGEKKVRCKLCVPPAATTLAYHGGTTSMQSHLSSHHPDKYGESSKGSGSQCKLDSFVRPKKCPAERAEEITRRIAEMVARDLRPISIVEGVGFKHLFSYVEPGYRVPSHTHIATVCRRLYNVQKERLKEEIAGCSHVALTTDIWTSSAVDSYLTVTVHFIDKLWQLCTRVLLTTEMAERHTGRNIADRLTGMADEWGIPHRSISAIVHDNAANAVLGAELTDWPHFGCVAHTLQLCVNSGLNLPVIDRLMTVSRKLVSHFKHSVVATTALRAKQGQLGIASHCLIQDVTTRWNSTFFMFERLVEQRVAIYAVLHDATVTKAEHKNLDLKEDQWELLSQMVTVLKPLQMATTVFSLEQNASCSIIYPVINGLLFNHLVGAEGDLPAVQRFKRTVALELERRFAPSSDVTAKSLPVLCAAVDPRYAHLRFLSPEQREITREELIGRLEALEIEESDSTDCTEADGPPSKKRMSPEKDSAISAMQFLLGTLSEKESIDTSSDEVEHFQKEHALDPDSNALEWWKKNAERLPTLSRLARQLLCIPATSVPSERIFSISGNIVTKKRASLKPENVDMLVFLNKNLPPIL